MTAALAGRTIGPRRVTNGGTSPFGGVGSVFSTVVGSILIGVLINGLVLMNVSS